MFLPDAWLSSEIFEYILRRDDAFAKAKQTKCPKDSRSLSNLQTSRHNPKKFWNNLLKIWGESRGHNNQTLKLILSDPLTNADCDDAEAPNLFNNFFCNIASDIQSGIKPLTDAELRSLNLTSVTANHHLAPRQFDFRDVSQYLLANSQYLELP